MGAAGAPPAPVYVACCSSLTEIVLLLLSRAVIEEVEFIGILLDCLFVAAAAANVVDDERPMFRVALCVSEPAKAGDRCSCWLRK